MKADFAVYSHTTDLSPELAAAVAGAARAGRRVVDAGRRVRAGRHARRAVRHGRRPHAPSAPAFDLGYSEGALEALADGGVLVSEKLAGEKGWKVGDVLSMRFARTGVQPIRIDGTYAEDDARGRRLSCSSLRDFEANYTDQQDVRVLVSAAPGVTVERARAVIEEVAAAFPNARVDDRAGYVAEIKSALDIVLAVVAILLGLAVIIAVLGIVNTLALSVVERTRELGLLRAVGMSRRQLRSMIRWESVNIALIGGVLGVVVGHADRRHHLQLPRRRDHVGHVPVGSARHVRGVRRAGRRGRRGAARPPGGPPRRAGRRQPRVSCSSSSRVRYRVRPGTRYRTQERRGSHMRFGDVRAEAGRVRVGTSSSPGRSLW